MALADTAKLVASLELQDKFSKPLGTAQTALGNFERKAGTLARVGDQVSRGFQSATQNLGRIGIAGAGLLTLAVSNGVRELEKLENATAQTNAVLESTQGVAGQTAESIRNLAEKYEGLNATIDDKVIQSGENLLLTFTNISQAAFEPALLAALNLNTALGGGEEGLQNTIIQVGKALQDPIRGLTNLRRVGVNFTEDQKKQIKALVAANDLYGAQQIILQELTTEFGGSFAAAGDTAAGKFAKVRDAVEDAQAALATAFLPVLTRVADKLGTFLSDPQNVQRIQDFGGDLAAGFERALEIGGKLPWDSIRSAFEVVGTGSKALLDAFLGLPSWVQTAVLTGWGLNKLTGGALGGLVGELGKGLIKGVLGMNAGVVNINAAVVNGAGGVPGVAPAGKAGGGFIANTLKWVIGPAAAAAIGGEIGHAVFFDPTVKPAVEFEQSQFAKLIASSDVTSLEGGLAGIDEGLRQLGGDTALGNLLFGDQIKVLKDQKAILEQKLGLLNERDGQIVTQLDRTNRTIDLARQTALENVAQARLTAGHTANAARLTGATLGPLGTIASKDFSPIVNVATNVNVTFSATQITQSITRSAAARLTSAGVGL